MNVPVDLFTAVRDRDLHFRQLHEKDGAPIEVQRWCSKEDVEVPFTTMVFAAEVRSTKRVDSASQKSHKPTRGQLDAAVAVIAELPTDWDPGKYTEDTGRA